MSISSDYMRRLKNEGRLIWFTPVVVERKHTGTRPWNKHKVLVIAYGAALAPRGLKPEKGVFRYLATVELYNLTTKRILSGFWKFLSLI